MARGPSSKLSPKLSIEQRLAALRELDTSTPKAKDALREALATATGIVIASAAKRIGEDNLSDLVPELVDAFEHLCGETAVKRDPGCRGKIAIARALHALDSWEERVFVAGLTIEQPEGMRSELTGSPDDTAAELRGICGLAHAHFARTDALDVLADLLVDVERTARIGAAQALGDTGRREATALLRLKLHVGDREPEVIAAAVESLLSLDRESQLPFVLGLLERHDEAGEAAALALGGARIASALEPLRAWTMGASPEQRRRVGYLALALLRCDPANEHLLELVRSAARADAVAAANALATFKADPSLAEALAAAGKAHKDAAARRDIAALLA